MSLFIGVTALALAVYGAVFGSPKQRRFSSALVFILLLFALGKHTPLFVILYEWVPGFDKFRGISKFNFNITAFLIMLAAVGCDRAIRNRFIEKKALASICGAAALISLVALWMRLWDWQAMMDFILRSGESYLPPANFQSAEFGRQAQTFASNSLLIAAGTLGLLAVLLGFLKHSRFVGYGIVAVAVIEIFAFARSSRETFDTATIVQPEIRKFVAEHPGDYRIINPLNPNSAMSMNAQDLWGFDPGVVRRHAEFIAFTQGVDPDKATQYINFSKLDRLYSMLRCRFAFVPDGNQIRIVEAPPPMNRLELIGRYRVLKQRDAIFATMANPSFDPRREVLLEREPEPHPSDGDGSRGTFRILGGSTDDLTIEAEIAQPSILLITDVYTPGWHVVPLSGSSQARYDLQPANYVLRAIPLAAGHHHFRVEYKPRAFVLGKWISIISLLCFSVAVVVWWRKRRERGL
jgi:hypothetical protein